MTAYRPEIDGLRAVAVLVIMLFHAGFAPFEGGFVGVDVFFVISGYLITTILLLDLERGQFAWRRFCERRVRRIVPALLLMLLLTVPAAWFILPPGDLRAHASATLATIGFSSNLYFWRSAGYFGLEAELNPLLHTWSLAVEEQYYLLFPLLLAATWRAGRRALVVATAFAIAASLALAIWGVSAHPVAAFYLLPARAWELLAGVALVLAEPMLLQRLSARQRELLGWLGLALILGAVFVFDRYVRTPGPWALVPVSGTVLVILAARPGTTVHRALAWSPVVRIGLISYGAYLWHQPVFAFARQLSAMVPAPSTMAALLLVSLGLAYLSWRWVEQPFRQATRVPVRPLAVILIALAAVLAAWSAAGLHTRGFEGRYSSEQRDVLGFLSYPYAEPYRDGRCFISARHVQGGELFGACWREGEKPTLAVWGDSHAAALASGLHALRPAVAQFTTGGCPPLLHVDTRAFPECNAANAAALARLAAAQPAVLLLHANWLNYAALDYLASLDETLAELARRLPATRIVLVGMAPQWHPSLPVQMVREAVSLENGRRVSLPGRDRLASIDQQLQAVAGRHGIRTHSLIDFLCTPADCQAVATLRGHASPITWDYGHMTEAGAALAAADLLQRLGLP